MEKRSFILYTENAQQWNMLSDEKAGQLIKAILTYAETGKEIETDDGMLIMLFSIIKGKIDKDTEKYTKKCEKSRESVKKRWETEKASENTRTKSEDAAECERTQDNTNDTNVYERIQPHTDDTDNDSDSDNDNELSLRDNFSFLAASGKKNKKFVAPGVEDVEKFVQENGFCVDARKFHAHYTAHGWRDRNGIPLSDWKGMVQVWHINAQNGLIPQRKNNGDAGTSCAAGTSSFDISDFEKLANRF